MHILIGLALVFLVLFLLRNRRLKNCRWRREKSGDKGALQKYKCSFCGAEAFTATSSAPIDCKADTKPTGL